MNEITEILIEVATDAKVFDDDKNIIQYKGWQKIQKDLQRKLKAADKYNPYKNFTRVHETITVIGERGTGKSTFILNLYNRLKKSKLDNLEKIHPLEILDPTLISTRQNILVNIITLIRKEVINSNNWKEESHENWEKSLKQLASGITQMENIGSNPYQDSIWDEAALVLDKGLKDSQGGLDFEKSFHFYIDESLKILKKTMFLLTLDDIDTNFDKGWEVLEVLRKYITSPQLITIVSGDMSLYSLLIRQKQWDLFQNLQKYEEDQTEHYKAEIDHLVEQYLIKVLHPENYINLYRLDYFLFYNKKESLPIKILGKHNKESDAIELFSNLVKQGLRIKKYPSKYIKLFAKLPIRSNMQIIKAYFDALEDNSSLNRKYFTQRLKDIFLSTFFKFDFDAQFIAQIREEHSIDSLLNKTIENSLLFNNLVTYQIDNIDEDINIIVTLLNTLYDAYFEKDINKYIEWYIKLGLIKLIIYDDISANKKTTTDQKLPIDKLRLQYIKYLQFNKFLSSEARVLKIQGLLNSSGLSVQSYRNKIKNAKIYFSENNKPTTTFRSLSEYTEKELLALLLLGSVKESKSSRQDFFSPLYILTFIEKIFTFHSANNSEQGEEDILDEFKEELQTYFTKLLQENYRLVNSYKNGEDDEEDDHEDNNNEEGDGININLSDHFITSLWNWIKEEKNLDFPMSEFNLAGYEFAKKLHISIKPENDFYNIAEYINSSIHLFLNQLLYQNYKYEYGFDSLTFKDIRKSNSAKGILTSNIEKIGITKIENLKFFNYFYECPIWNYYEEDKGTYLILKQFLITNGKMSPERFKELYKQLPAEEKSESHDFNAISNIIKETYGNDSRIRMPNKSDVTLPIE